MLDEVMDNRIVRCRNAKWSEVVYILFGWQQKSIMIAYKEIYSNHNQNAIFNSIQFIVKSHNEICFCLVKSN